MPWAVHCANLHICCPVYFLLTVMVHAVWRAFEGLVESGQVRQLGISNIYDLRALQDIYHDADVKPAVVQNRCVWVWRWQWCACVCWGRGVLGA
jgi:diketogulonate reductase-like aldo/keto reductase